MAKPPVGETTRIEVVIQPIACWDYHQQPEYGGRVVCNPREDWGSIILYVEAHAGR